MPPNNRTKIILELTKRRNRQLRCKIGRKKKRKLERKILEKSEKGPRKL